MLYCYDDQLSIASTIKPSNLWKYKKDVEDDGQDLDEVEYKKLQQKLKKGEKYKKSQLITPSLHNIEDNRLEDDCSSDDG